MVKEDDMTRLKETRLRSGMTQAAVAAAAGISLRTYQGYEQGLKDINMAAAITVLKLADVMDVHPKEIMEVIK